MFLKSCLTKKYAHNRNFTFNPIIYCYVHSNILPYCAQLSLNNIVSGVPKQAEIGVRNRRKSLLSSCNDAVCCSSNRSISTESVEGSNLELGHSSFSSSRRYFYNIKPNCSSESVRWYSGDKKVERSLTEDINLFDSSSEQTWDAPNSYEPHGGLSKTSSFSQAYDTVEDHFEAETDVVYSDQEDRSDTFYRKPSSVEYNEEILPSSATNSENIRALRRIISNARTCSEVLEIYQDQQNEMKIQHYDSIVRKLTAVIDRSQLKKTQWHPVMVQLFDQITRDCNRYNTSMLITLLKFLSTTRMPIESLLVRTTLQVLRKQFNNLDLKQLLYVDVLLTNMRQDPVGSALKIAVPLALEYRYRSEPLPADLTPFHLIQGLTSCVKSDTADSVALAEKFMMALYEREQGLEDLSPSLTVKLIFGLMRIFLRWNKAQERPSQELLKDDELEMAAEGESSEGQAAHQVQLAREVLFKEALRYIEKNINKLSHWEVEKVLSWLSYSYRQKDTCAYNQPLLRAYARRALEQRWPLRSLAGGVIWMLKMKEVDESLLQALLQKIHSASPEELLATELFVMPLVHALAASSTLASRSEQERHALLARLLQHPSAQLQNESGGKLAVDRLGFDLACLGYFEPDVHRKIIDFIAADIEKSGSAFQIHMKQRLIMLWQAQQLLNTKHERLQVGDALLATSKESVLNEHYSSPGYTARRAKVREVLQQALSSYGPNSVITAVHTRHGVYVDHVIVVRGESQVVPQPTAAEGRVCLDDLLVPDNARVLGVLQIGRSQLFNNYTKLRPRLRLHLQLLAAEGVTVVPFIMPQYDLHYRTDEEKMRYVTAALGQHRLYL